MNFLNYIKTKLFEINSTYTLYSMLALEYDEESSGDINGLQKNLYKVTGLSCHHEIKDQCAIILQSFGTSFKTVCFPRLHNDLSFVALKENEDFFFNPFTKLLLFKIGYMNKSGEILSSVNLSNEGSELIQNITTKIEPVLSYILNSSYIVEGEFKNEKETNIA